LNVALTVEVACTSKGAVAFPLTVLSVGNGTINAQGKGCESIVETDTNLPPNIFAPFVTGMSASLLKLSSGSLVTYAAFSG
jgi:hypothetical protein